jgi:hypothetical protein
MARLIFHLPRPLFFLWLRLGGNVPIRGGERWYFFGSRANRGRYQKKTQHIYTQIGRER